MNTMILKPNHSLSSVDEIFEMEHFVIQTLKWTFFFFLPIISGFKIAFNLFWRVACRDSFKWIHSIRSIKLPGYE